MSLRNGHGTGSDSPHYEVTLKDLPAGMPANAGPPSPSDHGSDGRFTEGNESSKKGGETRKGKTRLAERLGLAKLSDGSDFAPYARAAVSFRKAHCAQLATTVGGGKCGAGPSSIVATASMQLAWSRYFSDRAAETGGDPDLALKASRLGDSSRQNLLCAHELCAREAVVQDTFAAELQAGRAEFQRKLLASKKGNE